ncbi:MAG: hypothetical protein AB1492_05520 [Bacillota bacterium]
MTECSDRDRRPHGHGSCCESVGRHHVHAECCEHEPGHHAESCGCETTAFKRRFQSKAEKLDGLRRYLKELEAEAEAVRELIARVEG